MDIHRKPTSGEPFALTARHVGAFIDAASKGSPPLSDQIFKDATEPGVVLIRNDTGSDLTASHPVVGLGDPLILPADRDTVVFEMPCFAGETPDEDDHTGKFAICLGPVASGATIRAVLMGWSWCKLTINDANHDEAEIINGDTAKLGTVATGNGSARIVWRATSGTPRDAIVLVGCIR